jgi:hypothetical protein
VLHLSFIIVIPYLHTVTRSDLHSAAGPRVWGTFVRLRKQHFGAVSYAERSIELKLAVPDTLLSPFAFSTTVNRDCH